MTFETHRRKTKFLLEEPPASSSSRRLLWEVCKNRGSELFIFLKRDHGALLQVSGRPGKATQYEIGNPPHCNEDDSARNASGALRAAAGRAIRERCGACDLRIRQAVHALRAIWRQAGDRGWPRTRRRSRTRLAARR